MKVLENGVSLFAEKISGVDSISCSIIFEGGSQRDPLTQKGLAHIVEHMCFRKCGEHDQLEFHSILDANGILLYASTAANYVKFEIECQKSKFIMAFELLYSMLFCTEWNIEDFEKERKVILSEINEKGDNFYEEIYSSIFKEFYPKTILGSLDSINKVSFSSIVKHKQNILDNAKKHVILIGDFDDSTLNHICNKLSELKSSAVLYKKHRQKKRIEKVKFFKSESIQEVIVTCHFNKREVDDLHINILDQYLFKPLCGKFYYEAREKCGFVYSIETDIRYHRDDGILDIVYEVPNTESIASSLNKLRECIYDVKKNLTSGALNLIQNKMNFALNRTYSNLQWSMDMLTTEYVGNSVNTTKSEKIERLKKVTRDEIISSIPIVFGNIFFTITANLTKQQKSEILDVVKGLARYA